MMLSVRSSDIPGYNCRPIRLCLCLIGCRRSNYFDGFKVEDEEINCINLPLSGQ